MKVTLKIPVPGSKDMVVEADGSPEEVAQFLKLWLLSFQDQPPQKKAGIV